MPTETVELRQLSPVLHRQPILPVLSISAVSGTSTEMEMIISTLEGLLRLSLALTGMSIN
jgi:hypothetical protein